MSGIYWFSLTFTSFLSIVILAIIGDVPAWSYFIAGGIGIISLIMILRGVILPARVVKRGLDLIHSQDFNNRLVAVGESNADKIVRLFNAVIDKLRAERLYNREQEGLLKLLIDASPMGVVMLDFDGKITLFNYSFIKIAKMSKSENLIGKKIEELDFDIISEIKGLALGESRVFRTGYTGIYRCYHLNFIQEGFKRDFYLIESLIDEIRKAEREAYEKVIRTISHEVNNSIGGVRSVLDMVKENVDDSELAAVAESCDNRCENLISFIEAYSEVVKMPKSKLVRMDLANEIKSMVPFMERIIPEKIKLKVDLPDIPVYIKGDSPLLQQSIVNIIKNATESIEGDGRIKICLRSCVNDVILEISNNGKPITDKEKKEMFRPFFTTKKYGKGIGLTVVGEVLSQHGADYSLATGNDGITRFRATFKRV